MRECRTDRVAGTIARVLAVVATWAVAGTAQAREYIEVSGAKSRVTPVAIAHADGPTDAAETFTRTLENDLLLTGLFQLVDPKSFLVDPAKEGYTVSRVQFAQWRAVRADYLIKMQLTDNGSGFDADLHMFDCVQSSEPMHETDSAAPNEVVLLAHRWADKIYIHFTGVKGFFDTRIVYVRKTGMNKDLWVADFDGKSASQITRSGTLNLLPGWSRDGRTVAFTSYRSTRPMLYTVDVPSHIVRAMPVRGDLQTSPAFSPDGRHIAFTMSDHGTTNIYLMNPDGSALTRLTQGYEIDTTPTWSPNGKRIAFVSSRAGTPQIYVMNADGTGVDRLTFEGHYNTTPVWSPRGDIIAFTGRDERNVLDIFTIDVGTKQLKRLTQDSGNNEQPSFSPNGGNLIFVSTRTGSSRLWMMTADGRGQMQLANDAEAYSPAWGPWRN